jgi:hypothetical protein
MNSRTATLLFGCIALVAVVHTATRAQAPTNLVTNPGLELPLGDGALPQGWKKFDKPGDSYKAEVVAGGRSGEKALQIGGRGEYCVIVLNQMPVKADTQYAVRGWSKISGEPEAIASIKFDYWKPDGSYLDSDTVGMIRTTEPGWQLVSTTSRHTPPAGAATIGAAVAISGKGAALFDDMEMITRPAPAAGNLLDNGSMERIAGRHPFGYYVGKKEGGQATVIYTSEDVKDGWYALRLQSNAEWAIAAHPRVRLEPGKLYSLSGYVRVKKGTGQLKLDYFKGDDYLGQSTSNDATADEWQVRRVTAEPDKFPGATHIAATAVGLGETDVLFDGLVLSTK